MIVDNGSAFSWRDNGGRRVKSCFGMFCRSGWLAGCLAEVGVRSLGDLFFYLKKRKSFTRLVEYFTTHSLVDRTVE